MRIAIFDTETTGLEKCYCYNIGYLIFDTETCKMLIEREFVVEQIWHNLPLFNTAYYANKRPLYVNRMRAKKIKLAKFGNICQQMIRDFENFEVECAYAYNGSFDEKVFNFNCDWFKCCNPFETLPIIDIRGNVHKTIAFSKEYQSFCEENQLFTESGNYSTTAEAVFRFVACDTEFKEEHTALADTEIEFEILLATINRGCNYGEEYKVYASVPRRTSKTLTIKDKETKEVLFTADYIKRVNRKGGNTIEIELAE